MMAIQTSVLLRLLSRQAESLALMAEGPVGLMKLREEMMAAWSSLVENHRSAASCSQPDSRMNPTAPLRQPALSLHADLASLSAVALLPGYPLWVPLVSAYPPQQSRSLKV